MIHNEKQIIKQIKDLSIMLGGEVNESSTLDHSGRSSKKIVIEYDVSSRTVSR